MGSDYKAEADTTIVTDKSLEGLDTDHGYEDTPEFKQDQTGAPVESVSPLGYDVGWLGILFLNVSMMVGTGVFSTPGTILRLTGSVGLSLMYWVIGLPIAAAGLAIYMELACMFPNRSGAEVVYLEQAYPRPKYFFPAAFAVQSVILSFSSSSAIVLGQYLWYAGGVEPTNWQEKGLAVAGMTVILLITLISNKFAMRLSNVIAAAKVVILVFIAITGLVVLGGHTKVEEPRANFHNIWQGTSSNGYNLANALVKINFSFFGSTNAFNVMAEIKKPIKTIKVAAPVSLAIVAVLYNLANVAYLAAIPKAQMASSAELTAALFFKKVFGFSAGARALPALIAVSAFGHLLADMIGGSRVIRECARQGILPYTAFWSSTRPFGTPLAPLLLKWALTCIVIVACPAGDAFNFVVDLQSYPSQRQRQGIRRVEFQVWNVAAVFSILVNIFLLVMPWYPPAGGANGGDVSFWYATYCVVGLGIIAACAGYYAVWAKVLPYFGGYEIRQEVIALENGARAHHLVKVPKGELAEWDATHDEEGNAIETRSVEEKEKADERKSEEGSGVYIA
ncbi:amino acid transporter [Gloeophyllum trabeum ATCC 11539]|uniref:Amino acid transporter n=1 Tax=Gloeophyllum trabeum (strain ATCC 11539 / FP-39264 / Madison 617) TaxID=670483 RepID=S7RMK3_GLOTA|nr:amino acid transporter [Gloeophyllum trabeum ATCC 11539]EPQ55675.1 amino acid transporter [Gloeophyllum trabeum ATCC 11539]